MKNADGLVQIYNRLLLEVKKFGDLSKQKNLNDRVNYIKNKRISNIANILKRLHTNLADKVNNYLQKNSRSHLKAKSIIVLGVVVISVSLLIYLITLNTKIIYIGSVTLLINLFIFFLINIFSNKKTEEVKSELGIDYTNINIKTYEELISKLNEKKDDVFLVNAAWINALRAEAKRVYIAINESMEGQSYTDAANALKEKESKMKENDIEVNKILDSMISAEEYLKLRREIDILKIEVDASGKNENLQTPDKELVIKNIENLTNPLKSYLKKFFEYIDKQYIIKYV
jgi:hypothetical protein